MSFSVSPGRCVHERVLPVGRKIPVPQAHLTPPGLLVPASFGSRLGATCLAVCSWTALPGLHPVIPCLTALMDVHIFRAHMSVHLYELISAIFTLHPKKSLLPAKPVAAQADDGRQSWNSPQFVFMAPNPVLENDSI